MWVGQKNLPRKLVNYAEGECYQISKYLLKLTETSGKVWVSFAVVWKKFIFEDDSLEIGDKRQKIAIQMDKFIW